MPCTETKWWDPATIMQFFLQPSRSYSQPGMLWKAIAKSCGTAVFNWEWDWFPSWLFSEEGKPQFNSCFSPREQKTERSQGKQLLQSATHETKGIFFAAQPEEEGSDWHSDFEASHCGREVFCSHYSPMVLVIDSAFSWLWQRIKVSLSVISFTSPACYSPSLCLFQSTCAADTEWTWWPPLNMHKC